MFSSPDFCMICNGYDTIQTYARFNNIAVHVCESCADGKNEKEIVLAYLQRHDKARPRRAKADGGGARHE